MPVRTTGALLAGRYRTIERIGSGGMAVVLLAEDERLGRKVAVKRLHAESPEDTAERFRREARLGASLNHPNVVAVYDIVTDEEGVLIVMEYVDGATLRDAIDRGPVEPARAVEILRGLAAALDHAHGEGIVHRDVKPANVLLGCDGRTKLADLGIATAVEGTRLTMSGTVLGTAAYMAPEQLEGHKPGPATDVYALAVVAWETLSGRRAYDGRTPIEIAHRKTSEPPPPLSDVWPDAPAAATDVLARAMGPDPSLRPATATALVDELADALDLPRAGRQRTAQTRALASAPAAEPAAVGPAPSPSPSPAPADMAPRVRRPEPLADTSPRTHRPEPAPVAVAAAPAAEYARHSASRGRPSWLVPLVALLAVLAVGGAAVLALGGGSGSSGSDTASTKTAKRHAASKQSAAPKQDQTQTPAPSVAAPSDPTPAEDTSAAPAQEPSSSGGYQVPEPSGTSAAEGARLNDEGFALIQAGDAAGAIPVLERSLRSFPAGTGLDETPFVYALFNLGHALRLAGRPEDAVPVLEQRLESPDQRSRVQAELDKAKAAAQQG